MIRLALTFALVFALSACRSRQALPQGPQPFLIISVSSPDSNVYGTIAPVIDFDFSGQSQDGNESFSIKGTFIEKTPDGFRISWKIRQTVGRKDALNSSIQEVIPWGKLSKLKAFEHSTVEAYYSPVSADQLKP